MAARPERLFLRRRLERVRFVQRGNYGILREDYRSSYVSFGMICIFFGVLYWFLIRSDALDEPGIRLVMQVILGTPIAVSALYLLPWGLRVVLDRREPGVVCMIEQSFLAIPYRRKQFDMRSRLLELRLTDAIDDIGGAYTVSGPLLVFGKLVLSQEPHYVHHSIPVLGIRDVTGQFHPLLLFQNEDEVAPAMGRLRNYAGELWSDKSIPFRS
jgi:hypothetical protein